MGKKIHTSLFPLQWNRKIFVKKKACLHYVEGGGNKDCGFKNLQQLIEQYKVIKNTLCLEVSDLFMSFMKYNTSLLSGRSNVGHLEKVTLP